MSTGPSIKGLAALAAVSMIGMHGGASVVEREYPYYRTSDEPPRRLGRTRGPLQACYMDNRKAKRKKAKLARKSRRANIKKGKK